MSTSSNFPVARPSLLLDFAETKTLDPRITYSRSTTGTYYDGSTTTVAEQNLLTDSTNMNTSWTRGSITVTTGITDPLATTTAIGVVATASSSQHYIGVFSNISSGNIFSVYLKYNGNQYVAINGNTGSYTATFDVLNGVVVQCLQGVANITYIGNGWYRCVYCSNSTHSQYAIWPNASASVYTGDGVNGVYVWGPQFENRTVQQATAYTATTSSAITNYVPTLQTAAVNQPRFDHNPTTRESLGLLIEESRTNLLAHSSQFDSPFWYKFNASISANATTAPDGTLTAAKLYENVTNNRHELELNNPLSISSGVSYTFSIYLKSAERRYVFLSHSGLNTEAACFDLQTGTITNTGSSTTATITPVGNGWYRCQISASSSYTSYSPYICILTTAQLSVQTYTGDGVSGVYAWGAQLEQGPNATSYIPTPLTFTSRASAATYRADDGLIRSAATNTVRYERNSSGGSNVLLEAASTNLLTYTESLDNAVWYETTGTNIALNTAIAPDGSWSADKIIYDGTGTAGMYRCYTGATLSTPGVNYTASIYLKADTATTIRINGNGVAGGDLTCSLTTNWQRFQITGTGNGTSNYQIIIYSLAANNTPFSIYAWGAQIESGVTTASSYIPSVDTWTGRASTATYYNASGVLSTAASGVARTTYNPSNLNAPPKLLLEPAATNMLLNTDAISWADSYNVSRTANATISPDGNTTASKFIPNTNIVPHWFRILNPGWTLNTVYTMSVFVKAAEYSTILLGTNGNASMSFNASTGISYQVVSTDILSTNVQSLPNGWYRIMMTIKWTSGDSFILYVINNSGASTFAGDGTSGVYIWGAQLETGYAATSYIPTTSAAVTRAADTSTSATGSRSADVYTSSTVTRSADGAWQSTTDGSWYLIDKGTFLIEYNRLNIGSGTSYPGLINIPGSILIFSDGYNEYIKSQYSNIQTSVGIVSTNPSKLAVSYSINGYNASLNASSIASSTSPLLGTNQPFNFGYNNGAGGNYIRKIAYYPIQVSNAQLQALTS